MELIEIALWHMYDEFGHLFLQLPRFVRKLIFKQHVIFNRISSFVLRHQYYISDPTVALLWQKCV